MRKISDVRGLSHVVVLAAAIILAALFVPTAHGQAVNIDKAGVAIGGYDPVAYFTDNQAMKGAPSLTATYEGATYLFATPANRGAFLKAPAQYVPQYGGFCAYGVAQGHKVEVDPEAFRVVDGKLYLNYSKRVQKKWLEDVPGNIALADKNWPELR